MTPYVVMSLRTSFGLTRQLSLVMWLLVICGCDYGLLCYFVLLYYLGGVKITSMVDLSTKKGEDLDRDWLYPTMLRRQSVQQLHSISGLGGEQSAISEVRTPPFPRDSNRLQIDSGMVPVIPVS